jgi:hypothetical protein
LMRFVVVAAASGGLRCGCSGLIGIIWAKQGTPRMVWSRPLATRHGRSGSTAPEVDRELGWPAFVCDEIVTVLALACSLTTREMQNGNTIDQRICERAR